MHPPFNVSPCPKIQARGRLAAERLARRLAQGPFGRVAGWAGATGAWSLQSYDRFGYRFPLCRLRRGNKLAVNSLWLCFKFAV